MAPALKEEELDRVYAFLYHLRNIYSLPLGRLGELAFLCRRYEQARLLWEESATTTHPRYHEATARQSPYPQSLKSWEAAGRLDEVLRLFEEHGRDLWALESIEDRRRLARCFRDTGRHEEALLFSLVVDPEEAARMWCDLHPKEGDEARSALHALLRKGLRLLRTEPGVRAARRFTEVAFEFALALQGRQRSGQAAQALAASRDADFVRQRVQSAFEKETRTVESDRLRLLLEPTLRELVAAARKAREDGPDAREARLRTFVAMGLMLFWRQDKHGKPSQTAPSPRGEFWTVRPQDWVEAWFEPKDVLRFRELTVDLLHGPSGWLRKHEDRKAWKRVTDRVNWFAQSLLERLQEARRKGEGLTQELAGWERAGAVVGEAVRRDRAVAYWEELRDWTAEALPEADLGRLDHFLDKARDEKRKLDEARRDGSDRPAKRPERRDGPGHARSVALLPGERRQVEQTVIKVASDGTWVRIAFEEEEIGVRLQLADGKVERAVRAYSGYTTPLSLSSSRKDAPRL